ncbi:MAG: diguanylate cyclase [Gammaproteobacteria bacterium]|nr:diguanylate cyclase [Gammaproteobacteria bacterium]
MSEQENPRILMVDDVPENLQLLGAALKQKNYRIYVAQSGPQALHLLKRISVDLILLDVAMPGQDGFEVCKQLKASPATRNIPIIFLTAKTDENEIVKGFELGAVDYVTKPFNSLVLSARVKTHLTLTRQARELQVLANIDCLTGIANRRRFLAFLDSEWRRCLRNQTSIAMIMLDIDFFKAYNDTYGHLRGDETLRRVAKAAKDVCRRPGDLPVRYGGEEFAIVLSNTELEPAYELAENLRVRVEGLKIPHERSLVKDVLTVSLGVAATVPGAETSTEQLVKAADDELYNAKKAGRNRVMN